MKGGFPRTASNCCCFACNAHSRKSRLCTVQFGRPRAAALSVSSGDNSKAVTFAPEPCREGKNALSPQFGSKTRLPSVAATHRAKNRARSSGVYYPPRSFCSVSCAMKFVGLPLPLVLVTSPRFTIGELLAFYRKVHQSANRSWWQLRLWAPNVVLRPDALLTMDLCAGHSSRCKSVAKTRRPLR